MPSGRPVENLDDACAVAEEIGGPVVVKPRFGNQGRAVATNLTTCEQVVEAYGAARAEGYPEVIVESFAPGDDYRLLVVGDRLVAAVRREPRKWSVTASRRSPASSRSSIAIPGAETTMRPLSRIKLDAIALAVLKDQGFSIDSIPVAGHRVLIRRNANLSTGGTATDVTDIVHPENVAIAVEAVRVVGLDVAGVDMVALDIARPLHEQTGVVVEVNAGPGLRMHLEPSSGSPRPVGEAIVNSLFPSGDNGRIPIVAVTGVNGKTTTTRLDPPRVLAKAGNDRRHDLHRRHLHRRTADRNGDCSGPKMREIGAHQSSR